MSITDSSTELTATWTENSYVAFTSGVLSTMATCVTEVEGKLKRGTLSTTTAPTLAQVQNWLKRAKLELMEFKNYTFARKYAYVDLTAGTYRYALPPDFNGGNVVLRDTTNDRAIPVWLPEWFDKKYPDPSEETNNEVLHACIKNMELWVAPPPDSSDRIELEYARSGAETTADDFSYIPELERFRCCDFALSHAFESLHMFDVSDRYRNYWDIGLVKSVKADNRRKRGGRRMCAINVWQEFAARNYQSGRDYRR
jgi:hypothetical protein